MPPRMIVPSRLQQPLFIDTDINYNLDKSKFPGLDDPQHMYEPALLIATSQDDSLFADCKELQSGSHLHCPNSSVRCTEPTTKDVLEELLNIIDSCSSELLDRLVDTSIQDQVTMSGDNMYKSVMDACVYKPQIRTVPRNNHIATRTNNVNHPISDRSTMMDYYNGLHYNTQSVDVNTDLPKHHLDKSSLDMFQGFQAYDYTLDKHVCKRKRSSECSDFPVLKRQCYTHSVDGYSFSEGYTDHYRTFQENGHSRGLMV